MHASGPSRAIDTRTARGLAALEAVLLFVIAAAALALAAGQMEASRTRMRQDLASRQLDLLREALVVYYLDQGAFPPGRLDLSARQTLKTLRQVPPAARLLAEWPAAADSAPEAEPLDPWRNPYRYLHAGNDRYGQVADNGHWPLFVSAGPDGWFGGMADPAGEVDNRRTDELPVPLP